MKKIFTAIFLILLTPWVHPADFKIMAGLSVPKSTEPVLLYALEFSAQPGFGIGLVAGGGIEFSLTRTLAFEIDALYIQKGSRLRIYQGGAEQVVLHRMARIDELSIPVLFKAFLRRGNSPYVLGGGEYALVLTEGPRNTDYGLVGGIGYRRQLKGIGVSFEARYHHGFRDMRPEGDVRPELSANLRKMRAFVVMAGLTI